MLLQGSTETFILSARSPVKKALRKIFQIHNVMRARAVCQPLVADVHCEEPLLEGSPSSLGTLSAGSSLLLPSVHLLLAALTGADCLRSTPVSLPVVAKKYLEQVFLLNPGQARTRSGDKLHPSNHAKEPPVASVDVSVYLHLSSDPGAAMASICPVQAGLLDPIAPDCLARVPWPHYLTGECVKVTEIPFLRYLLPQFFKLASKQHSPSQRIFKIYKLSVCSHLSRSPARSACCPLFQHRRLESPWSGSSCEVQAVFNYHSRWIVRTVNPSSRRSRLAGASDCSPTGEAEARSVLSWVEGTCSSDYFIGNLGFPQGQSQSRPLRAVSGSAGKGTRWNNRGEGIDAELRAYALQHLQGRFERVVQNPVSGILKR
ncbi:hypothetical protein R1flu_008732 [Riccia fluitans]|uniref:Uncharacterized protein n=1 Tax=Riccia fluitans TaxID=41844 RepID=A0ABD1YFM9_9MARC